MREIWRKGEDGKYHSNYEGLPPGLYCLHK